MNTASWMIVFRFLSSRSSLALCLMVHSILVHCVFVPQVHADEQAPNLSPTAADLAMVEDQRSLQSSTAQSDHLAQLITSSSIATTHFAKEKGQKSPVLAAVLPLAGIAGMVSLGIAASNLDAELDGYQEGLVGFQIVMAVGAVTVAPAFGQFYAGNVKTGLITTGVRAGGVLMGIYGVAEGLCILPGCTEDPVADLILLGGAITIVGAAVFDLIDAPLTVMRQNTLEPSIQVRPTLLPSTEQNKAAPPLPGLAVSGTF